MSLKDNEIRVFNRGSVVTSGGKTLSEMDELYPRTKPSILGRMVKGMYIETHADRRALLDERVLKNPEAKSMAKRTLDSLISAGETAAKVMRFR